MKNILEAINRITEAEEWISELEDRMVEITATEPNEGKRMKTNEDSLRDLWDNVEHSHYKGPRRRRGRERASENI